MQKETNDKRIFNIVFVVCHPDDEAIWIGGLISEFSTLDFIKVHVVCLSGGDSNSKRLPEFLRAKEIAGYHKGYISREQLHQANDPLPDTTKTVVEALKDFDLDLSNIDVIITHPPFGDEHGHPHHIQVYRELLQWTDENNIPFGYFSTAVIPFFNLRPILQNMRIIGTLHLLKMMLCTNNISLVRKLFSKSMKDYRTPKYYLEFLSDTDKKRKMIECYNSIDLEAHRKGYASYSQNSESIYIMDENGLLPFQKIISVMEIPGRKSLFPN